jgi:UMF1 family MFS transporter
VRRGGLKKDQWSWILIDVGNSAFATTILAALFPVYLPSLLPPEGVTLSLLGVSWSTSASSLWGYTVSASLFLTLIVSLLLGAWADRSGYRKFFLGAFTLLGVIATFGLGIFDSWKLALSSFVLANIGFSGSNIFYNSLIDSVGQEEEYHSLSLKAFAWGYVGGGLLLAINLLLIMRFEWFGFETQKSAVQLSFQSVSAWWAFFTVPALLWIREKTPENKSDFSLHRELSDLKRMVKHVASSRNMLLFMIAFALFNDGIQTVISMASIYGKESLKLAESTLIGTLLIVQFLGLPFTLLMTKAAQWFGAKKVLMGSLIAWIGIIVFALTMETNTDFLILGVLVSVVLGVSQALPRSIFASFIPKSQMAEYFSFFALSGKMTSILGPSIFAFVKDATGNPRMSILALGILFVAGTSLLGFVSVDPRKVDR